MIMNTNKFLFPALLIAIMGMITSCSQKDNGESVASCEGCHINYGHLQKVFTPDSEPPPSGCGGSAPYYEPYDRVYISPEGLAGFKSTAHYELGCTGCHNGVDGTSEKDNAHSGDFIAHPSSQAESKCGSCHSQVVDNYKTSIHNGMGQMRKVAVRSEIGRAHV